MRVRGTLDPWEYGPIGWIAVKRDYGQGGAGWVPLLSVGVPLMAGVFLATTGSALMGEESVAVFFTRPVIQKFKRLKLNSNKI